MVLLEVRVARVCISFVRFVTLDFPLVLVWFMRLCFCFKLWNYCGFWLSDLLFRCCVICFLICFGCGLVCVLGFVWFALLLVCAD